MRFLPVVVLMLGCSTASSNGISKEDVDRDLQLNVRLTTPKTIAPGQPVALDISLVNRSKTTTYPVVKPGDGSSVGWREPYVFFSATRKNADDQWENVPKRALFLCGNFDSDWHKDVIALKPGTTLAMNDWIHSPSNMLEFEKAGPVRLYLHYRFSGGRSHKRGPTIKGFFLGSMKGVPEFEIVSEPIEIEIVRPLEIRIKVKSALKAKTKTRLSDLIEVELENRSTKPIKVASPTISASTRLQLQIQSTHSGWQQLPLEQDSIHGIQHELMPGAKVSLLGDDKFANGIDGSWEYPEAGTVRLRARYFCHTFEPAAVFASEWVNVKVEK